MKTKCNHTPCPSAYMAWFEWVEKKRKTHKQIKCPICGHYKIWVKNEG